MYTEAGDAPRTKHAEGNALRSMSGGLPPLLVFLVLGAGVFALDRWLDDGDAERRSIEVTEEQVDGIRQRWVAQFGRPPTDQELEGLLDDAVHEEILYREAQRLGLDRDDAIVRRRLAQKMTFVLEDNSSVGAPSDGEVEAEYTAHADRYREPGHATFGHVFVSHEGRADAVSDARALLQTARTTEGDEWRGLGDQFMLLREYADRTDQEIAELFGRPFAAAVAELDVGDWSGPIESAYGTHLVRVVRRVEPRAPVLDEVRHRVVADLLDGRRREQNRAAVQSVRERYDVRMPEPRAVEIP